MNPEEFEETETWRQFLPRPLHLPLHLFGLTASCFSSWFQNSCHIRLVNMRLHPRLSPSAPPFRVCLLDPPPEKGTQVGSSTPFQARLQTEGQWWWLSPNIWNQEEGHVL